MKILLVSSTKFEVNPLLKKLKKISAKGNLSHYHFGKHSVEVLLTGVGMVAAAFHLGKTLSKKYDLAINAGAAGSFKKNIPLGTVMNVVNDCFGDLGAEEDEKFLTIEEMKLAFDPKNSLQDSWQLAVGKRDRIRKMLLGLPDVKGITVNTVHGNSKSIKKIVKKFNPDIESMEGAAFFFACNQKKIPCIQIRAVSNYVERRNKKKWKMKLAVKNLNLFLEALIKGV